MLSVALVFPLVGRAYFPRTDPGQFVISLKAPTGTRLEVTDKYVARVEEDIRSVIPKHDLEMIVSNIGITPDLSAIYTSNSAMHTAFVQVNLTEDHAVGSYAVHGTRAPQASERPARVKHLLSGGRPGGFGGEPGLAGASGHSGERQRLGGGIWHRAENRVTAQGIQSRQRCV